MDVKNLEPADRDPVKLRRTAYALVAFMVFGGFYMLNSYDKYQTSEAERDSSRPSYKHQVKNFGFVGDEGKVRQVAELQGKVWVAFTVTKEMRKKSQATIDAAIWLAEQFQENPEKSPTFVVFVLDIDADKASELAEILPDFPKNIPIWRIAAGEGKTPVKEFLKNSMRFGIFPHLENGEWLYDSNLLLLDQKAKVRGLPNGDMSFDFETVAKMEAAYAQAEIDHPSKELNPLPMTSEKFRQILLDSVLYLQNHPPENPRK